ncbi:uncharacterized protein LOC119446217 isoform X2 [Dermacentor silvarum]|uniref:uncharacterized protein LOC119446217 isoform X2 n=1 Tax=Dermacentor silvarum TaxID=543639 RepID=UPI00189C1EF7|nr:uncharacterized protein LOC119446217 isoform X2 [Dermacentor silvarum]
MTTLKGHSGSILDLDFNANGKYLATSADGRSSQRAVQGHNNWHKSSSVGGRTTTTAPRGPPSPLEGAWRLPLCADDLYHQLLRYRLTPQELYRCGYPRPCPDEPGRAVWLQADAASADSSRKTCCRCGSSFVITPGGEYYANDLCTFHTGRRGVAEFTCCGATGDEPGCEHSDYHVCAQGARGERDAPARGFVRTRPRHGVAGGVYALDCEMCFTIRGLEVAKVSVVGSNGATVYDSYVRPGSPVLDYNTAFSGVHGRPPAKRAHHAAGRAGRAPAPVHRLDGARRPRPRERPARPQDPARHRGRHGRRVPAPPGPAVPSLAALAGRRVPEPGRPGRAARTRQCRGRAGLHGAHAVEGRPGPEAARATEPRRRRAPHAAVALVVSFFVVVVLRARV